MDAEAHARVNPWVVTFAVMLATFMEVLDTTVVNVSIPHIAGNLAATIEEGTWVVTSYLVSNAIILPMSGMAGELHRQKEAAADLCGGVHLDVLVLWIGHHPSSVDLLSRAAGTYRRRFTASRTGHPVGNLS